MTDETIAQRLEYLRAQLRAECISLDELIDLQSLADHIPAGDTELLEAAGVPESDPPGQLVTFPAGPLGLDDALAVWEELRETLSSAEWPRLEVVPADPDEDGEPRRLRCPRCGYESTEVISADLTAERWNTLESDEAQGDCVYGEYYGYSDYHSFLYRCVGCEKPVSLPGGWSEE